MLLRHSIFTLVLLKQKGTFWPLAIFFVVILLFLPTGFSKSQDTVRIGLLVPEKPTIDVLSQAAVDAAQLAISEENLQSGSKYIYKLIVRSCDGPWGMGSKASVRLIYDDKVCAIVGSLDGRNAHLAEQVAAKSHVVFLSTRATDPTLSQAYVPWYFRIVPNDDQQASVLLNKIINSDRSKEILVVTDDTYDAEYALKSFLNKLEENGIEFPEHILLDRTNQNLIASVDKVKQSSNTSLVLFMNHAKAELFIPELRRNGFKRDINGQFSLLGENRYLKEALSSYKNVVIVSSQHWESTSGKTFQNYFTDAYLYSPGSIAAYCYDGMKLLLRSVQAVGPDQEKMKEYLREINYTGVTGFIQFDKLGNRQSEFEVIDIEYANNSD